MFLNYPNLAVLRVPEEGFTAILKFPELVNKRIRTMTKNVTPAVIFLCTGNSCRSILAESLWHEESRGSWKCASAGTRPTGIPHPLALKVLEEEGISVSDIKSQGIE